MEKISTRATAKQMAATKKAEQIKNQLKGFEETQRTAIERFANEISKSDLQRNIKHIEFDEDGFITQILFKEDEKIFSVSQPKVSSKIYICCINEYKYQEIYLDRFTEGEKIVEAFKFYKENLKEFLNLQPAKVWR